jgi:hypothetical protein
VASGLDHFDADDAIVATHKGVFAGVEDELDDDETEAFANL